jgi:hypothetical protein
MFLKLVIALISSKVKSLAVEDGLINFALSAAVSPSEDLIFLKK